MNDKQLYDVWRNKNLYCQVYSRKQIVETCLAQNRLDYFLVSEELKPMVKNIYYNDCSLRNACTNKGNNKITELRTILQRESQNS